MIPTLSLASQIQAVVAEVEDVGTVHTRRAYVTQWSDFLDKFKVEIEEGVHRIRGWEIMPSRPVADAVMEGYGSTPADVAHVFNFVLRGVCGVRENLDEDSYAHDDFQTVAWNVKRALDAHQAFTFDGWLNLPRPATWQSFEIKTFGSVACWVVEITRPIVMHEAGFTLEV